MSGSAIFGGGGVYRYSLTREWGAGERVCFVMLNPSTADSSQDDPTIRRCIGYAKAIGAGSLEVVNLFALRATDPAELERTVAPVGPDNDVHIARAAQASKMVICAWGAHRFARLRASLVFGLLRLEHVAPMCLRRTKDGYPAHPLYLPAALRPVPFGWGA